MRAVCVPLHLLASLPPRAAVAAPRCRPWWACVCSRAADMLGAPFSDGRGLCAQQPLREEQRWEGRRDGTALSGSTAGDRRRKIKKDAQLVPGDDKVSSQHAASLLDEVTLRTSTPTVACLWLKRPVLPSSGRVRADCTRRRDRSSGTDTPGGSPTAPLLGQTFLLSDNTPISHHPQSLAPARALLPRTPSSPHIVVPRPRRLPVPVPPSVEKISASRHNACHHDASVPRREPIELPRVAGAARSTCVVKMPRVRCVRCPPAAK